MENNPDSYKTISTVVSCSIVVCLIAICLLIYDFVTAIILNTKYQFVSKGRLITICVLDSILIILATIDAIVLIMTSVSATLGVFFLSYFIIGVIFLFISCLAALIFLIIVTIFERKIRVL
jgi:hypothetical protein